jgi:hypothetical protein
MGKEAFAALTRPARDVMSRPPMTTLPALFSKAECARIIAMAVRTREAFLRRTGIAHS